MRIKYVGLVLAVFFIFTQVGLCAEKKSKKASTLLDTDDKKICYALGYNLARNLELVYQVDLKSMIQGIQDAVSGKAHMEESQVLENIERFNQAMVQRAIGLRKKLTSENQAKGAKFIAVNKKKQSIITLDSGLQYEVLKKGSGKSPVSGDTVQCHYVGKTIDGKIFDSSYQRKEPVFFEINKAIKGLSQALRKMKPGSKWRVFIPDDLAYGEKGVNPTIPPGSTLIFEVELLAVNPE